jgi:hypothetical protein
MRRQTAARCFSVRSDLDGKAFPDDFAYPLPVLRWSSVSKGDPQDQHRQL